MFLSGCSDIHIFQNLLAIGKNAVLTGPQAFAHEVSHIQDVLLGTPNPQSSNGDWNVTEDKTMTWEEKERAVNGGGTRGGVYSED